MNLPTCDPSFSQRLIQWQAEFGRHDLPWQTPEPYAVWVSEIMLQQTQVSTVLNYYQRFMQRFSDVHALAAVEFEQVAPYWAGLGYYARARNLHRAARIVAEQGFPQSVPDWEKLPGIGRSTAGAIHALAQGGYGVILDGNVKRVLSRWLAFEGELSRAAVQRKLWQIATGLTPETKSGPYAQALMDLGSLICTRSQPRCDACPVSADCQALANNQVMLFPQKKPKTKVTARRSMVLAVDCGSQLLWVQAGEAGIWGGLWGLPMFDITQAQAVALPDQLQNYPLLNQERLTELLGAESNLPNLAGAAPVKASMGAVFEHRLSHIAWTFYPINLSIPSKHKPEFDEWLARLIGEQGALSYTQSRWMQPEQAIALGLPKPMQSLASGLIS